MFERYAIFYTAPAGPLADFGASWLGWNCATGRAAVEIRDMNGIDVASVTAVPRKYGLHGTLKAPFRLAENVHLDDLQEAATKYAALQSPLVLQGMELRHAHGFVALRPIADTADFNAFAGSITRDFDRFRAPLTDAEIARRRRSQLTPRQDQQMLDWGYPFIFADFRFHLTLTGPVNVQTGAALITTLKPLLINITPAPFVIDAFTLMGEDADGMFHQIHRYALTG